MVTVQPESLLACWRLNCFKFHQVEFEFEQPQWHLLTEVERYVQLPRHIFTKPIQEDHGKRPAPTTAKPTAPCAQLSAIDVVGQAGAGGEDDLGRRFSNFVHADTH